MKKPASDLPGQAFLELLRPPKLATTRFALFASYSADPIVMGGALMQLSVRGRDDGTGSKVDFANSLETLRDRVRFIVQRGRIHCGRDIPKITAVLDQFVVEMPYQERDKSWHPKIALICFEAGDGRRLWRCWIGSRNLTQSRDLDLGLAIDGEARRRKGSRPIAGMPQLGAALAREARLAACDADTIERELNEVRWIAPENFTLHDVTLRLPGAIPMLPFAAEERRKLLILSPFLCDAFIDSLAAVPSADRTLITTLSGIRDLSHQSHEKLREIKLLSLASPVPEGDPAEEHLAGNKDFDGDEEFHGREFRQGLHAKLFAAIKGNKADIIMGSANATNRAWSGRNAEVIARFTAGRSVVDGLRAIEGAAFPVPPSLLVSQPPPDEAKLAAKALDQLRWQISEMPWTLERDGMRFQLRTGSPLHIPAEARLEIGLATTNVTRWEAGWSAHDMGTVPLALQTDLIQFRLTLEGLPAASWLQRATVTPALEEGRDSAAISRLLSVAGLQSWIQDMLTGDATYGPEDDWSGKDIVEQQSQRTRNYHTLSLEDILSASARGEKAKLRQVDAILDRYVSAILAHDEHLSPVDRDDLDALQSLWKMARGVLLDLK